MTPARRRAELPAALLAALVAAPARAHAPVTGLGDFYGGLLHPAVVPAHALAIVALGLLAGARARADAGRVVAAFAAALVVALVVALGAGEAGARMDSELALLALTAVLGLLVALDAAPPPAWCAVLAAVAGAGIGLDPVPAAPRVDARVITAAGTALGATTGVVYAAALSELLRRRAWARIAVRVLGSWCAASALMVLALRVAT